MRAAVRRSEVKDSILDNGSMAAQELPAEFATILFLNKWWNKTRSLYELINHRYVSSMFQPHQLRHLRYQS